MLQCGVVSAAAWFVAESWLGHEQPVFAATSAVICLTAGTGGRGRQAVDLLAGVFAGLLVGQLARALPPEPGVDVLCAATLLRATGPGTRPAGAADDVTAAADGLGQPGNPPASCCAASPACWADRTVRRAVSATDRPGTGPRASRTRQ